MESVLLREVEIMGKLKHANVVQLFDCIKSETTMYVVMELVPGGDLATYLSQHRVSEAQTREYFRQLVSAVSYCHSKEVVHRDLKPENILLSKDLRSVTVTDFGLSSLQQLGTGTVSEKLNTFCGTIDYLAPEVLELGFNTKRAYSGYRSDVWSLGVILYRMLTCKMPFTDANMFGLASRIMNGAYDQTVLPPGPKPLVVILLDKNPKHRPKAKEILQDKWILAKSVKQGSDYQVKYSGGQSAGTSSTSGSCIVS
ncbi:CBL-interacting serine/threonine-protein kinase 11 [Diplonema papillatum]|nr:CBL-interacting serine/threonine-protein kinase 11 [Diplonema papillatum]